jgi:hypothetical protein
MVAKKAGGRNRLAAGIHIQHANRKELRMARLIPALTLALGLTLGAACARSSHVPQDAPLRTVLKVENQGFPDMNIFVVPEGSNRVRLGTVTGNSNGYFTLPEYLLRGTKALSFQALPIATPRGPISQSIIVTPGDTVVLTIPPV